jgi:ABC-type sugar transport system permease subunit
VLVVRTVEAFRVFDIIYVITAGGPANGTQVVSYLAYQETFRFFNMGRGAALSFLISLFVLAAAFVYIRVLSGRRGSAG